MEMFIRFSAIVLGIIIGCIIGTYMIGRKRCSDLENDFNKFRIRVVSLEGRATLIRIEYLSILRKILPMLPKETVVEINHILDNIDKQMDDFRVEDHIGIASSDEENM